MRDQIWFLKGRRAGWTLGAILLASASCGNDTDGFTPEEWKRVKLVEPLGSAMPDDIANSRADDDALAKLGQSFFYEKEFAEAITVAGPTGAVGDVGKVGCVTCHDNKYFSDSRAIPVSHGRSWLTHNTPAMVNLGWNKWTLWTGSLDSLFQHGAGAWGTVATPLAQAHFLYKKYKDKYNAAFPDTPLDPALDPAAPDAARFPATGAAKTSPTAADGPFEKMTKADQWAIHQIRANLARVFEAYPRKLVTRNSKFERYINGTDRSETSFSPSAKNGLRLFIGKASCIDCHNGPLLSDGQFHNIGVPTQSAFPPGSATPGTPDRGRAGALRGLLNNAIATLRTNEMLTKGDPVMDQIAVFSGAGQFSDNQVAGRQRIENLEAASCKGTRGPDAVPLICANLFRAPVAADDTKTPPVKAVAGDPRYDVCLAANTELGLCAHVDDTTKLAVDDFDPLMEGAFRTPSLINIAETGPYFHTGEFKTLHDVVWHYNQGGAAPGSFVGTKSPRLKPLLLTENEINDIVEFLRTLTGDPPDFDWACNPLVPRNATTPNGCDPNLVLPPTGGASGTAGAGGGGGKGGTSGTAGAAGSAGGSSGKGGGGGTAQGGMSGAAGGSTGAGGGGGIAVGGMSGGNGGTTGAGGLSIGGAGGG